MKRKVFRHSILALAEVALCALLIWPVMTGYGYAQAPFYKGKNVTVIAATNAGGTADMRIRTVISALARHIPGNPTIVVEYMPGGGGRKAANQIFRTSAPDGLPSAPCSPLWCPPLSSARLECSTISTN